MACLRDFEFEILKKKLPALIVVDMLLETHAGRVYSRRSADRLISRISLPTTLLMSQYGFQGNSSFQHCQLPHTTLRDFRWFLLLLRFHSLERPFIVRLTNIGIAIDMLF